MQTPNGSWGEYAVAPDYTTAILPSNISFEGGGFNVSCGNVTKGNYTEAATIPLAAMTSAEALFRTLALPGPWAPATTSTSLLVYGGSSAVGAFAIKLAMLANIHPIVAVAGAGCDFVSSLLDPSKGDEVFDYRDGSHKLEEKIRSHLSKTAPEATTFNHAVAAVSNKDTIQFCCDFLGAGGVVAHFLPLPEAVQVPTGVTTTLVMVGDVHSQYGVKPGYEDLGYVMNRLFTRWLQAGTFKGHPFEVVSGGLDAVPEVLKNLKEGKASAVKYVFRVADTSSA